MKGFMEFVGGAVCGAAVGAALGLLLAPASGEKFRQSIRDHIDYVITEGRQAAESKQLELERKFAEMREVRYE